MCHPRHLRHLRDPRPLRPPQPPQPPQAEPPPRAAACRGGYARTALVLSGGCLRGFAHIGVLKALERLGHRPGLLVGASVGAVIGALWAAGRSAAQIERAALALDIGALKCWSLSWRGLWRPDGLRQLLDAELPHRRIEAFPMRFAAVATDAATGELAIFARGGAGAAVVASAAMPGFFVPPSVGGRAYVDGCLVSPLPVRAARRLGAARVLAVNVLPNAAERAAPGWLDRLLRPSRMMLNALAAHEAADADVLLAPELPPCDPRTADGRRRLIEAGERCALASLAALAVEQGRPTPRSPSWPPAPAAAPARCASATRCESARSAALH